MIDSEQIKAFRVDRIEGIAVTSTPFVPRYALELSGSGPISALDSDQEEASDMIWEIIATMQHRVLGQLLPALPTLQHALAPIANGRVAAQLAAHERVREVSRIKGRIAIHPVLPVDILASYVLLHRPNA